MIGRLGCQSCGWFVTGVSSRSSEEEELISCVCFLIGGVSCLCPALIGRMSLTGSVCGGHVGFEDSAGSSDFSAHLYSRSKTTAKTQKHPSSSSSLSSVISLLHDPSSPNRPVTRLKCKKPDLTFITSQHVTHIPAPSVVKCSFFTSVCFKSKIQFQTGKQTPTFLFPLSSASLRPAARLLADQI